MASRTTEPTDLGRLAAIDERRLDVGVVLWGRFMIIGSRREYLRGSVILVEDLDRQLGEEPLYRVELHLLEVPGDRARLRRASVVDGRMQPRTYATAETDKLLALFCEPTVGKPIADANGTMEAPLERVQLLAIAAELSGLLTKLHASGITGVRFGVQQIRSEQSHFGLDGFAHLFAEQPSAERDLDALVETLQQLGGGSAGDLRGNGTTARAVWEHLKAVLENEQRLGDFELPGELPFVGRISALATLEAGISQARIAQPTVIVVQGDRGIGKSRLLREFVSLHLDQDLLVLTGAGQVHSGDTHSGLLGALEQLSKVLTRLDPDERDDTRRRIQQATKHLTAILLRSAPGLGSVLRHAEELPQLESLGGDFSRHTAVIADVFKALGTRQRPLLLVIDNVESLDANSAAVLDIITQSRPAHYTLVVLGLRTGAAGYRPEFEREQIDLKPLSLDEVSTLLTNTLDQPIAESPVVAQYLWSATNGFPLALGTTLRSWIESGRLTRGTDGIWRARKSLRDAIDEQPSMRDLIDARLNTLDARIRKFALDCAVLGTEVRAEILQDLADDGDGFIVDLSDRGIVVRTDVGVRFSHDTIREVVLEFFSTTERREAHQRVSKILTKRNAPIAQIVYHRDLGFDSNNATPEESNKLSRLHVEAGRDRLDVYDLERARWHLERALEHSQAPDQRGLAAEGLADICLLQEDIDTAVALYTAIIATASPVDGVRVAAKVAQFLYGKNAIADARQLGAMALEMAHEPIPTSPLGKLWVLVQSLVRPSFGPCKFDHDLRDALCRLYVWMAYVSLIDDPVSVGMYTARARWIAIGLRTGSAAVMRSIEAALLTVMGFVERSDQIYALCNEIARESRDAWAEGMVFHHWGTALLGNARYSDGQDRLDDGIAAFREAGDVSIMMISMFEKALYGRDREHANKVLGWIDEALTTARRHGKRTAFLTLQSLKLHVLARQGRSDLEDRLIAHIAAHRVEEIPGMERLASLISLGYACLELGNLELAMEQVRESQALAAEMGGAVPEFCQEVHLVASLVVLELPAPSAMDRKLLRKAVRKFRAAIKKGPRLRVFGDYLELRLALEAGKTEKARQFASKIISEFDTHENLAMTLQAHRLLARLLKGGENIHAATEHERVAFSLGRRLGLSDHVLLRDVSEIGQEVAVLALAEESDLNLEITQTDILRGAGMLSSTGGERPSKRPSSTARYDLEDQSDVLRAYALTEVESSPHAPLGSIVAPVRAAVSGSIDEEDLEIICPNPEVDVTVASGDLQVLLINMILGCRDAVGQRVKVVARLEDAVIEKQMTAGSRVVSPGRYLVVHVSATGGGTQIPIIGAFVACENLAQILGGTLSASTDRGRVALQAYVPMVAKTKEVSFAEIIVAHPDPAIRDMLGAALDELGATWRAVEPKELRQQHDLAVATVLFADGKTLAEVNALRPFWNARLIELVERGSDSELDMEYEMLHLPVTTTELRNLLAG
jgi:predicted ATPase